MKTIELHITLQPQVLDTQGQALNRAVHDLGYTQVNDIRVGKLLYMTVDEATDAAVHNVVTTLSEKLLQTPLLKNIATKYWKKGRKHNEICSAKIPRIQL